MITKLEATHAVKINLEGDTRHENKLGRRRTPRNFKATHAKERNLEGYTCQKLVQTATHAIMTKFKAKHAMQPNLEGDTRHENELRRRHTP